MKRISFFFIAGLTLSPLASHGAQTAQARLYCLSVTLHKGTNLAGDQITVNSTGGLPSGTDEVIPTQIPGSEIMLPGMESYASIMWLYDATFNYASSGTLYLTLPAMTSQAGGRFPDFFDVATRLNAMVAAGSYDYTDGMDFSHYNGSIQGTWSRAAGSRNGTCQLRFSDPYWGTFYCAFEILEYTGTLSYTAGSNVVSGTVNLTQTGNPTNKFQGPIQFVKSVTDRFNQLTNQPGVWLDASNQMHYFTNHYFFRESAWPTNYAGYIEFDDDGTQSTYYPYGLWVLSITDTNDSNHDGIPDFSDDPTGNPLPRQPRLTLAANGSQVLLSISGDVGRVHQLQESDSLSSPSWQLVSSLTLTNDPQTVPLAVPASTRFWRVLAK